MTGSVDLGGVVEIVRYSLQTGQVDYRDEAGIVPQIDQDDGPWRECETTQPVDRIGAHGDEYIVKDTVVTEDRFPDEADRHSADRQREENTARYTLVSGPGRFTSTANRMPSAFPASAPGIVKKNVMRSALRKESSWIARAKLRSPTKFMVREIPFQSKNEK